MKTVLFITGLIVMLLAGPTAGAQLRKIPAEVTESFAGKFPNAKGVEWKDRLTGFTAGFTDDDISYLAAFKNDGTWESTEHEIAQEDAPAAVGDGFEKSKYADWTIIRVVHIEFASGEVQYRIEVGKGDIKKRNLYYNTKGRLVKDKLTL